MVHVWLSEWWRPPSGYYNDQMTLTWFYWTITVLPFLVWPQSSRTVDEKIPESYSTLPLSEKTPVPDLSNIQGFFQCNQAYKKKQKKTYNKRHRVAELPIIPDDTKAGVTSGLAPTPGRVIAQSSSPRSYLVDTPTRIVHYNLFHLITYVSHQRSLQWLQTKENHQLHGRLWLVFRWVQKLDYQQNTQMK